jgi:hypothetical protein
MDYLLVVEVVNGEKEMVEIKADFNFSKQASPLQQFVQRLN